MIKAGVTTVPEGVGTGFKQTRGVMHVEEWKWWKEQLYRYEQLDRMSDKEIKRLVLSCLLFIVNAIGPENSDQVEQK